MTDLAGSIPRDESGIQDMFAVARARDQITSDMYSKITPLLIAKGRWVAGGPIDGSTASANQLAASTFNQSVFFAEKDGFVGNGSGAYAVYAADFTYTASGATLAKTGAFANWEWYDGAYIQIHDDNGAGFDVDDPGVFPIKVPVTGKTDDDTITLDVAFISVAPSNGTIEAYVSTQPFLEIYTPIPCPLGTQAEDNIPPSTHSTINQSKYWGYGFTIPPLKGGFGNRIDGYLCGRIKADNIDIRPWKDTNSDTIPEGGKVSLYFVLDPWSNPHAWTRQHHERQFSGRVPMRKGWAPDGSLSVTAQIEPEATLTNGEEIVLNYTSHGFTDGALVHVCLADPQNADPYEDFVDGQLYILDRTTVNKCRLATAYDDVNLAFTYATITSGDVSAARVPQDVIVTLANNSSAAGASAYGSNYGSRHAVKFEFVLDHADIGNITDNTYYQLHFWGVFDGTTSQNMEGVIWYAELELFPSAESVGFYTINGIERDTDHWRWKASIPRTAPGAAADWTAAGAASSGGPLLMAQRTYYNESFTSATWTEATKTLSNSVLARATVNSVVTVSSGSGLANGSYVVSSKPTSTTAVLDGTASGSNGTVDGSIDVPCFYRTNWDYSGNYYIVNYDATIMAAVTNAANGEVDLPLVSYRSNGNIATVSYVSTDGGSTYIGEVCYHDDALGKLFIRNTSENGETYVERGDTVTISTYKTATSTVGTSASQTKTLTAGTVDIGPHPTHMGMRIAVSGPPNGDVTFEVRTVQVYLSEVGSS